MVILGVTGPTGSGKTTLLREAEQLGGAVIDCDGVYHRLLEEDAALQAKLEAEFGPLRDGAGHMDRKRLGAIVFHSPERLERLNAIAWRAITGQVRAMLDQFRAQGRGLAVIDAVALAESGLGALCTHRVAVLAPAQVRVERIMAREGISEQYAWSRVRAQRGDEYFIEHCDHVLVNDCASAEEFARRARKYLNKIHI